MKTSTLFLLALLLLFINGCKVDPPLGNSFTSLYDFHAKYGVPAQTFLFDAAAGGKMITASGVEIEIPDSAFRDYYGNVITGELTLEVKEFFKKSEMVLSGMHTAAHGGLLATGGMFHIEVKQGEQRLYNSNLQKPIITSIPASTINPDMRIFGAWPEPDPALPSDGYSASVSNWYMIYPDTTGSQSGTFAAISYDTIPPLKYILATGMGFINCDYFPDTINTTTLTVKVNEDFATNNIAVYLAFADLNSVMRLYTNYSDFDSLPLVFTTPAIPVSQPATVILFGIKDSTQYLGVKHITLSEGHVETIGMEQATQEQILSAMENLDN